MSFFPNADPPKEKSVDEDNETSNVKSEKLDPRNIIIDGSNLIKLVADNPDIKPGKTDKGIFQFDMWVPVNYNPETGEII
jgi:hypothetical protein